MRTIAQIFVAFSEKLNFKCQARLWACGSGDVSTPSFGSYLNPIST